MPRASALVLSAFLLCSAADARHRNSHHHAQPSVFDYYLFVLSWAPEFCASHPGSGDECDPARHHGFVVHGLWPQNANNSYPSNCPGPAFDPTQVPAALAGVMPSAILAHEWLKHGRCSGTSEAQYFGNVVNLWQNIVHIPTAYQHPAAALTSTPGAIQSAFTQANPGSVPKGFVEGDNGHYMSQVEVCLNKDFTWLACAVPPNPHPAAQISIRPVL